MRPDKKRKLNAQPPADRRAQTVDVVLWTGILKFPWYNPTTSGTTEFPLTLWRVRYEN